MLYISIWCGLAVIVDQDVYVVMRSSLATSQTSVLAAAVAQLTALLSAAWATTVQWPSSSKMPS